MQLVLKNINSSRQDVDCHRITRVQIAYSRYISELTSGFEDIGTVQNEVEVRSFTYLYIPKHHEFLVETCSFSPGFRVQTTS